MSNPESWDSVTAIDILLQPDDVMLEHARAVNARLIDAYPDGFTLDAAHRPHITMLQRFVGTADLDKVYAASATVFAGEKTRLHGRCGRSSTTTSRLDRSAWRASSWSPPRICSDSSNA